MEGRGGGRGGGAKGTEPGYTEMTRLKHAYNVDDRRTRR